MECVGRARTRKQWWRWRACIKAISGPNIGQPGSPPELLADPTERSGAAESPTYFLKQPRRRRRSIAGRAIATRLSDIGSGTTTAKERGWSRFVISGTATEFPE